MAAWPGTGKPEDQQVILNFSKPVARSLVAHVAIRQSVRPDVDSKGFEGRKIQGERQINGQVSGAGSFWKSAS